RYARSLSGYLAQRWTRMMSRRTPYSLAAFAVAGALISAEKPKKQSPWGRLPKGLYHFCCILSLSQILNINLSC
ncbi:MAG: hypothetical protein AAFQ92_30260, partial [Bacteroidota bacterium]